MSRQAALTLAGLAVVIFGCSSSGRRRAGDAVNGTDGGNTDAATSASDTQVGSDGVDVDPDTVEPSDGASGDGATQSDAPMMSDGSGPDDGTSVDVGVGPTDTGNPPTDTGNPQDTFVPPMDTNTQPVGLLGKLCGSDADCQCTAPGGCGTNATHVCLLGVCTAFCQGEQSDATACHNVAPNSAYKGSWACPNDVTVCLPGSVQGQNASCGADSDCTRFGVGLICGGQFELDEPPMLEGLCVPDLGKGKGGASCAGGDQCASNLCLGTGVCADLCGQQNDCKNGQLCLAVGFLANEGDQEGSLFQGGCVAFQGSLAPCTGLDSCPSGEYCDVSTDGGTLQAHYSCRAGSGTSEFFATCSDGPTECATGSCLLTQSVNPYCSGVCPTGDCPDGAVCRQAFLNNGGTIGVPDDDATFGLCVADGAGYPCLEGLDEWCGSGFCDGAQDPSEGIGLCSGEQ